MICFLILQQRAIFNWAALFHTPCYTEMETNTVMFHLFNFYTVNQSYTTTAFFKFFAEI